MDSSPSTKTDIERLQQFLEARGALGRGSNVLDAGCGCRTHLDTNGAVVVGIDISEGQLSRHPKLNQRIQGDIQTYPLGSQSFDLVVCWDVLEHLPRPEIALRNLLKALREGGYLVLAAPNLLSVKGLITKFTPHGFHVWAYKNLWGSPTTGAGDHGPFPTYFRLMIAPRRLRSWARSEGLIEEFYVIRESAMQRQLRAKFRILDLLFTALEPVLTVLTLGTIRVRETDFIVVLRKQATPR
jgi:2-polyprenyl-3-methyl-5-hydroxy-6-metoxy-1,4-benzoquinol methylase